MPQNPVFDDQGRNRRSGFQIEYGVMADTQPAENVQIGSGFVQKLGLSCRVTYYTTSFFGRYSLQFEITF